MFLCDISCLFVESLVNFKTLYGVNNSYIRRIIRCDSNYIDFKSVTQNLLHIFFHYVNKHGNIICSKIEF